MKNLFLVNHNCSISITEEMDAYKIRFKIGTSRDNAHVLVLNFRNYEEHLNLIDYFTDRHIYYYQNDEKTKDLEVGLNNDMELELYFMVNDYNEKFELNESAKEYELIISRSNPQFDSFDEFVNIISNDKMREMQDDYRPNTIKYTR